jgi:hypothetical protein
MQTTSISTTTSLDFGWLCVAGGVVFAVLADTALVVVVLSSRREDRN